MIPLSVLVTGGGGAGIDGSGQSVVVNPSSSTADPAYVTFKKADNSSTGSRGGPVPTYPNSVTMAATVTLNGVPTRQLEGLNGEARPLSKATVKIVTGADPATYLGAALATDDLADWRGQTWLVAGTSIFQAGSFVTIADLTT